MIQAAFYKQHDGDGSHKPSFCCDGFVLHCELLTPPPDPEEEDAYVIPAGATDDWAGQDGKVALFRGGEWEFLTPKAGSRVFCLFDKEIYFYESNAWYPCRQRFTRVTLADQDTWEITHCEDLDFKRSAHVYHEKLSTDTSLDFDEADESDFSQEDSSKTCFHDDTLHLKDQSYAHYHLNQSSGVAVPDSSGNDRDGTAMNIEDTDWVAGKLGNALQLDGSNEYIDCGAIAGFERTDTFSLEGWFKTTATGGSMILMAKRNASSNKRGYELRFRPDANKFVVMLTSIDNVNEIQGYFQQSPGQFNDGNWHHIVLTYDGSSDISGVTLYIDNVVRALTTQYNNLTGTILNPNNFFIGRDGYGFNFNGVLDEIVIYDKELSASEVSERWNAGTGIEGNFPTAAGYYVHTNLNQLNTSGWLDLDSVLITQSEPTGTQLRYLVSVDDRSTWKRWNGAAWETETLANIHINGNTKAELEALTETEWDLLFTPGTLDFAFGLKSTDRDETPNLDQLTVKYNLEGKYKCKDSEIDIILESATVTKIKNISGATLEDLGAVISV